MRPYFKNYLYKIFSKFDLVINVNTPKSKILSLINSLKPVKTQLDLIRIGTNGDGGYLIPDDLEGIEACFSPGVDKISEFELECIKRDMKVFMADWSVEKPNLDIPETSYNFQKKFIGSINNEKFITMDSWVNSSQVSKNSDLLLQMDIEFGEYNTIINMSETLLKRFRIIVIEFHKLHHLWNPQFFDFASIVFEKLLQNHVCVHIHPNNCKSADKRLGIEIPRIAEFTFIRKDRVKSYSFQTEYPHPLDFDNSDYPSIILPKIWYQ